MTHTDSRWCTSLTSVRSAVLASTLSFNVTARQSGRSSAIAQCGPHERAGYVRRHCAGSSGHPAALRRHGGCAQPRRRGRGQPRALAVLNRGSRADCCCGRSVARDGVRGYFFCRELCMGNHQLAKHTPRGRSPSISRAFGRSNFVHDRSAVLRWARASLPTPASVGGASSPGPGPLGARRITIRIVPSTQLIELVDKTEQIAARRKYAAT
jgi:hypothetical protein